MSDAYPTAIWLALAEYDDALIPQLFASKQAATRTADRLVRHVLADDLGLMEIALRRIAGLSDAGTHIDFNDLAGSYISIFPHALQTEASTLPR